MYFDRDVSSVLFSLAIHYRYHCLVEFCIYLFDYIVIVSCWVNVIIDLNVYLMVNFFKSLYDSL